jgi:cyclopropane-fatty-acyl-phospholipid synthase
MREQNVAARIGAVVDRVAGGALRTRPLNIRFWDGSVLPATEPSDPDGEVPTAVVKSPKAFAYLVRSPGELGLGRAWVSGAIDLYGDVESVLRYRTRLRSVRLARKEWLQALAVGLRAAGIEALRTPPRLDTEARPHGGLHSLARDRQAIRHHYDVSNDFYALILGPTMVYSCAYYSDPSDTLEQAQEQKLDLICRKLQLRPGMRMLDIGCGWGSLILHAASHYGVHALGVTLSEAQAELARERIAAAGLQDRCEVRVCDYRELAGQKFDAIASVGMYEHVGAEQLSTYVRKVKDLLAEDGLFLNHGITRLQPGPVKRSKFISRFVFPDGDLQPVHQLLTTMHENGLEVRDVESMREHYTLTLRAWVRNLEANRDAAIREAGVEHERIWRIYMTGSAQAFEIGEISIYQTLTINRGARHRLPLDRERMLRSTPRQQVLEQSD